MHRMVDIHKLRKFVACLLMVILLAFAATPFASAQRHRHRSFWKKHRDKLTVVGTTVGGAAIGGLAGGRKGALIGSAVGAGSGAVYTYGIRKRHRHRRRY